MSDLRTEAIILRRTNYGETDRIINFLTPSGKISALAKGVRKEKSRLAGGIELFSVSDIVVHQRQNSQGLAILTGAKMLQFYQNIITNLPRLELASSCLKQTDRAAEQADNPEYFTILNQVLKGLNQNYPDELVSFWFRLNLARASGEEINLVRDTSGTNLHPDETYFWDATESALRPAPNGPISAREIKLARLVLASPLKTIAAVQNVTEILPRLAAIAT